MDKIQTKNVARRVTTGKTEHIRATIRHEKNFAKVYIANVPNVCERAQYVNRALRTEGSLHPKINQAIQIRAFLSISCIISMFHLISVINVIIGAVGNPHPKPNKTNAMYKTAFELA